jgi:hypothetical protein
MRLHVTLIVLVPSFALLARWQIDRALGGNGLSWAYAFEWPLFALYAFVVWWRLLHDDDPPAVRHRTIPFRNTSAREAAALTRAARTEAERAEYNAYLAALRSEDASREGRSA